MRNKHLANATYFFVYSAGFAWVGLSSPLEAYAPLLPKNLSSNSLDAGTD
jgi:hypothetical protein